MGESSEPRDSFNIIGDVNTANERLARLSGVMTRLANYRQMLLDLATDHSDKGPNPQLRGLLTDRAYEAELDVRMFLKDGIDSLNDLRDSGRLETTLRRTHDRMREVVGVDEINKGLRLARDTFQEQLNGAGAAFFDEAEKLFRERKIELKSDGDMISVSLLDLEDKERSFSLSPAPLPGYLGRISSAEFFSPDLSGGIVLNDQPYFVVGSSHHDSQIQPVQANAPIDLYGSMIASAAAAREMMYRHARLTDEVGSGAVRGEDPVTGVLIGLGIIAFFLVVGGAAIEIQCAQGALDGNICDFGEWLILGGVVLGGAVCVASGGCSFLIGNVIIIAA